MVSFLHHLSGVLTAFPPPCFGGEEYGKTSITAAQFHRRGTDPVAGRARRPGPCVPRRLPAEEFPGQPIRRTPAQAGNAPGCPLWVHGGGREAGFLQVLHGGAVHAGSGARLHPVFQGRRAPAGCGGRRAGNAYPVEDGRAGGEPPDAAAE